MATYCFKCKRCDAKFLLPVPDVGETSCPTCGGGFVVRDYRAENVGVQTVQLKNEREAGGKEGYKNLFLPNNKDFAGPGDPDGTKGMREWREKHEPKDTNSKPWWPGTVEKKVM